MPITSTRSTSFPRAAGRPSVTPIARSSPCRIDVITPVAAQANTRRLTRPAALTGVAIVVIASSTSFEPLAEIGSASTICLTTLARTESSWRIRPKIETSTIASGAIENRRR